ncbi:hypothetical protein GCM10025868_36270 [Angustibacter aerolatus]|uniref:CshA domain-containing protein n=1 Tax=Angustibacter aerolatus TaxID=1162965 RepID=A0ABQ6JJF4_9ACTN|nr:hypothetical protein GCM10025868_36270 [Angustibacter aerolatus]
MADAFGQTGEALYTATVQAAAAPTAGPLTSTGTAPAAQHVTVPTGGCGSVRLLDDVLHVPVTTVTRTGEGTYAVAGDVITFTPAAGYSGTPAPVGYRVADAGLSADSTYTPTVVAPAPPAAAPKSTSGTGQATQSTRVTVPAGGSVSLVDAHGDPATTVTVAHVGTYVLDPATGVVAFTPAAGFSGTASPVTYAVTDRYGQVATAVYTPHVAKPAAPRARPVASSGPEDAVQQQRVTVPAGGAVTLLDARGRAATRVAVAGQGTYVLDRATGVITFTPAKGYHGTPAAVRFRIADAYGQTSVSRYAPRVTASTPAVVAGTPRLTAPVLVRSTKTVPATCTLSTGKVRDCWVTAYATVDGRRVPVGFGHRSVSAKGRSAVVVQVRLNALGRGLAARVGGVRTSRPTCGRPAWAASASPAPAAASSPPP